MTVFVPVAEMIPSQDVEVCCENCGAIDCLTQLSEIDKRWLFACTEYKHDQEEMQAVEFIERLLQAFPNTRNQLIRGKVDERCLQLDWALISLNATRNTPIDHDAYRARVRGLEEHVESKRLEISKTDSLRENASDADEEEVCRLLRDNPRIFKWLHGVFKLDQVKERLNERIASKKSNNKFLPCGKCKIGWVYITRRCYDSIYHERSR